MHMILGLLLLLSRVRFRTDVPLNKISTQHYGMPIVRTFRNLQKTKLRRDVATLDLIYLSTCMVEGCTAKFLYFKSSLRDFSETKLYRPVVFKCLIFLKLK